MYTIYLTTECNFKCTYCYEGYSKHQSITSETLIKAIEFIFRNEKSKKVRIGFMGGEPLLKKNMIFQTVAYIDKHYKDREVVYHMTTNCSFMDDELIEMMKQHDFRLRLSFDGTEETHNLNRQVKSGESKYQMILKNIHKVKDNNISYCVRMTVADNTIKHIFKNIKYLHEQKLDSISMVLDVNMDFTKELGEEFKTQMEFVAEYYLEEMKADRKFGLDLFNGKYFTVVGKYENCFAMCGAGQTSFQIMPDGKIYPCSYLTNNEDFSIGDVNSSASSNLARKIANGLINKESQKCNGCEIQSTCHGMKCGYLNYLKTGYINVPSQLTCRQEKIIYPLLTDILTKLVQEKNSDLSLFKVYLDFIERDKVELTAIGKKVKQHLSV